MAQPKNGTYINSFLNTNASGCGMSEGSKNVSSVDWCLTSKTAGLFSPVGKCSQPLTRTRITRNTRAPAMAVRNQARAMDHSGLPRIKIEAPKIANAKGTTVAIIHSMCKTERMNGINLLRK